MNKSEKLTGLYLMLLLPFGIGAAIVALLLFQIGENWTGAFSAAVSLVCIGLIIKRHFNYVGDIRREAASSETAERFRAEQAETHVEELQHYVEELERSSEERRVGKEWRCERKTGQKHKK